MRPETAAIPAVGLALALCTTVGAQQGPFGGLGVEIEVIYDQLRTPHIFPIQAADDATRDRAAFYALGYTQGRDFPFKTLDNILSNAGRAAQLWGPAGLAWDARLHRLDLRENAEAYLGGSTAIEPFLEAFAEGVNDARAWWAGSESPSGPERFRELYSGTGADLDLFVDPVPNLLAALVQDTEHHGVNAIEHFFLAPELDVAPVDLVAQGLALSAGLYGGGPAGAATNSWAGRSSSGVYVMNDSHLPTDTGSISPYFVQIEGGSYRVSGWTIPGFPCVITGFNHDLAWGTSVGGIPAQPPFAPVNHGHSPVVANVWTSELLGTSGTFHIPYGTGGTGSLDLFEDDAVLDKWVPATNTHDTETVTRWYAEPEPGAVTPRYPLLLDYATSAEPSGDTVRFEQIAALSGPPAWEFFIGMGRCHDLTDVQDLIEDVQYGFGGAINLVVADRTGDLQYTYLARVPIQGTNAVAASPWNQPELLDLDGSDPLQRWLGFHPGHDLPTHVAVGVPAQGGGFENPEVLINCNVSPHVAIPGFSAAGVPEYMMEDFEFKTWRQQRAEALLGASSTAEDSLDAAADVQDELMRTLWPYFAAVGSGDSNLDDLLAFLAVGTQNGTDFGAEVGSTATPYTSLLLSYYQTAIAALAPVGDDQRLFGFEASLELPDVQTFLDPDGAWNPNREAMEAALTSLDATWAAGTLNVAYFDALDDFLDASLAVNPHPHAALLDGPLRWGLVNQFISTPHFLDWETGATLLAALQLTPCQGLVLLASMAFFPPGIGANTPPFSYPFHTDQRVAVYPLPGNQYGTLFATSPDRGSYANSMYDACGVPLYIGSTELSSIVPFQVELAGSSPPVAHYMSLVGSTSITRAVSIAQVDDDERWLTSGLFASRTWTPLVTDYATLAADPRYVLEISPDF